MDRNYDFTGPIEGPVLIGDIFRKMYPNLLAIRGNDALLNDDTDESNDDNDGGVK